MSTRRDRLQVYADILREAKEPILKTWLMGNARITFRTFMPIFNNLLRWGYLKKVNKKYTTTAEGWKFMREIEAIYKKVEE